MFNCSCKRGVMGESADDDCESTDDDQLSESFDELCRLVEFSEVDGPGDGGGISIVGRLSSGQK